MRIKNLTLKYDDTTIIEDVSTNFDEGDFIILAGYSGSGKSTFINGINKTGSAYMEGEIYIDDKRVDSFSADKLSKYIGSVLQNPDEQIIFDKVEDELAFPLENLNVDPKEIYKRLLKYSEKMNLNLNHKTDTLSLGQKQRLITSATLLMQQKILIFDEPFASLDKNGAIIVLDYLKELSSKGYIIILCEHRLELVMDYVNRYMLIKDKKLIEYSTKEELYNELEEKIDIYLESKRGHALIKLRDISIVFKDRVIIEDFNYTFYSGEKYIIKGENGSGKTTLINIITSLIKPTKGKVEYSFSKKDIFNKIGLVMQNPNYQLFMSTVKDEVYFRSKDDDFTKFLIEEFELGDILLSHPHALSEGQKRRVGFVSVLSNMPDILILDEPSVGQDYLNIKRMLGAIKELEKYKETTVITISHDERCVDNFGDKFIKVKKS